MLINPFKCFFGIKGHVALDRNPGPGYNTIRLRLISGDLLNEYHNTQFHTLPGLQDSRTELSNFYPDPCVPSRKAVCIIFMMVFGMTQQGHEPATYGMRGGHTNHYQTPIRMSTCQPRLWYDPTGTLTICMRGRHAND